MERPRAATIGHAAESESNRPKTARRAGPGAFDSVERPRTAPPPLQPSHSHAPPHAPAPSHAHAPSHASRSPLHRSTAASVRRLRHLPTFFDPGEDGPGFRDIWDEDLRAGLVIYDPSKLLSALDRSDSHWDRRRKNMHGYVKKNSATLRRAFETEHEERERKAKRTALLEQKLGRSDVLFGKVLFGPLAEASADEDAAEAAAPAPSLQSPRNTMREAAAAAAAAAELVLPGGLQTSDYFGPEAKPRFAAVYRDVLRLRSLGVSGDVDEETRQRLADLDGGEFDVRWDSPRHAFARAVAGLETEGILPEPSFVRIKYHRKRPTDCFVVRSESEDEEKAGAYFSADEGRALVESGTIDLSHRSIGDAMASSLAQIVPTLPGLDVLILRDNRLTDVGIAAVLDAVCAPGVCLVELDLSGNDIDTDAILSIARFLGDESCRLRTLRLDTADLDDAETGILMAAVSQNTRLDALSIKGNILGGFGEKLGGGRPRPGASPTGGVAVAMCMVLNTHLVDLDLSWNMLATASGVAIGRALSLNRGLKRLNLAYNCIGDVGAQALGQALDTNGRLSELNVGYCGVKNRGAQVLAEGLRDNYAMETLDISGNAVGVLGGRALLSCLNTSRRPRKLILDECTFDTSDGNFGAFDPDAPSGAYSLDMRQPFDWMRLRGLLWIAMTREGCNFKTFAEVGDPCDADVRQDTVQQLIYGETWTVKPGGKRRVVHLTVRAPDALRMPKTALQHAMPRRAAKALQKRLAQAMMDHGYSVRDVFLKFDRDQSGFMDVDEIANLFKSGFKIDSVPLKSIEALVSSLDPGGTGMVGPDELDDFVKRGPDAFFVNFVNVEEQIVRDSPVLKRPDETATEAELCLWAAMLIQSKLREIRKRRIADQRKEINATTAFSEIEATTPARSVKCRQRFTMIAPVVFETGSQQRLRIASKRLMDGDRPYVPPGPTSHVAVECTFRSAPQLPTELGMINATGVVALAELLVYTRLAERVGVLRMASSELRLLAAQAQDMIDRVNSSHRPFDANELVDVLATFVPRIVDVFSVGNLVDRNLSYDQTIRLRARCEEAYNIFAGAVSGHHRLDLNKAQDRAALFKLAQLDATNQKQQKLWFGGRRAEGPGSDDEDDLASTVGVRVVGRPRCFGPDVDVELMQSLLRKGGTAQHSDFRGFRNIRLNGRPIKADALESMALTFGSSGVRATAQAKEEPKAAKGESKKGREKPAEKPSIDTSRAIVDFDYVSTLRHPTTRGLEASDNRVDLLLHSCGMHFHIASVAANPRLVRLLPNFLFQQALTKRKAAMRAALDFAVCSAAQQRRGGVAEVAASLLPAQLHSSPSMNGLNPAALKGCYRDSEDLSDWLAKRGVDAESWDPATLEQFRVELQDLESCALTCALDKASNDLVLHRIFHECRIRVCHPFRLACLTWRRREPATIAAPAQAVSDDSEPTSPAASPATSPAAIARSPASTRGALIACGSARGSTRGLGAFAAAASPAALSRSPGSGALSARGSQRGLPLGSAFAAAASMRGSLGSARSAPAPMTEAYASRLLQSRIRGRHSQGASKLMKGGRPAVETFIDSPCRLDDFGRIETNPVRHSVVAVVQALKRRGILVDASDVRLSLRIKTEEDWSCTSLVKTLPGDCITTRSSTYYYDAYVRGLPDDFTFAASADEPFLPPVWTPFEDAENPPTPPESAADRGVHRLRLATTSDVLTAAQACRICKGFESYFLDQEKAGTLKKAPPLPHVKAPPLPDFLRQLPDDSKHPFLQRHLADLVVHLFSRTADTENFYWTVLHPLFPDPGARSKVVHRLGWLNVFNPRRPEILRYVFDLAFPDHFKMANVMTQIAAVEPGRVARRGEEYEWRTPPRGLPHSLRGSRNELQAPYLQTRPPASAILVGEGVGGRGSPGEIHTGEGAGRAERIGGSRSSLDRRTIEARAPSWPQDHHHTPLGENHWDPMPGWELPAAWDAARYTGNLTRGVPKMGILVLDFDCETEEKELRNWLASNCALLGVPRPKVAILETAMLA
ncbi:hypothetical protein M885DRAFT_250596 [Pelagophyceae sp. CCMP2097]|nr:hypothetical protein M885DRAFT_250596 [Pelagophyceae sp. CCMP2097]